MATQKTTEQENTKSNTTESKTDKVNVVATICQELQDINNTIVTKSKDKSQKDLGIQYSNDEIPRTINTNNVKIVSTNYETRKTTITFYRGYITKKVSEIKNLNQEQYIKIWLYVEQERLYQAYNLFVSAIIQNNKKAFIEG